MFPGRWVGRLVTDVAAFGDTGTVVGVELVVPTLDHLPGTGETCAADASSEFDVDSTVAFTVTNETDTDKALAVWKFPEAISDGGIFHAEPSRVGDVGYAIEVVDVPIKGDAHDLPHTFNESGGRP